jgi:hypothetical protein
MHAQTLKLFMRVHIMFNRLYKIAHIYFLLRIIVML